MRLEEYVKKGFRKLLRIAVTAAQEQPSRRKGVPITFQLLLRLTQGDEPVVECAVDGRRVFRSDSGVASAQHAVAQFNELVGALNPEELGEAAVALEELFKLLAGAGDRIGVDPSASIIMEVSYTESGFVVRVRFSDANFHERTNRNVVEALEEVLEEIENCCSPVQAGA